MTSDAGMFGLHLPTPKRPLNTFERWFLDARSYDNPVARLVPVIYWLRGERFREEDIGRDLVKPALRREGRRMFDLQNQWSHLAVVLKTVEPDFRFIPSRMRPRYEPLLQELGLDNYIPMGFKGYAASTKSSEEMFKMLLETVLGPGHELFRRVNPKLKAFDFDRDRDAIFGVMAADMMAEGIQICQCPQPEWRGSQEVFYEASVGDRQFVQGGQNRAEALVRLRINLI